MASASVHYDIGRKSCLTDVAAVPHMGSGRLLPLSKLQDSPLVQQLYAERLDGQPYSHAAQQLLHTQYHRRDKPTSMAMVGDW